MFSTAIIHVQLLQIINPIYSLPIGEYCYKSRSRPSTTVSITCYLSGGAQWEGEGEGERERGHVGRRARPEPFYVSDEDLSRQKHIY